MRYVVVLCLTVLLMTSIQCTPTTSSDDGSTVTHSRVVLDTTEGSITLELFDQEAPQAVEQFLRNVEAGYYDNSVVHDIDADGTYFQACRFDSSYAPLTSQTLINESGNGLANLRGRVAVYGPAAGGEGVPYLLFNVADNSSFDAPVDGTSDYTVIGRISEGLSVADSIAEESTESKTATDGTELSQAPQQDIIINRITTTSSTGNNLPVADAGEDQTVLVGQRVTLDASASSDVDGDTLSYVWRQTSGPTVTLNDPYGVEAAFTYEGVATLTFQLTVSDGLGGTSTDTVTVSIQSDDNEPPVADAGEDQDVLVDSTVTLSGAGSSDPDTGDTLSYQWTQTSGTTVTLSDATAQEVSFTAPSSNDTLEFLLTVTDSEGGQATDTVQVTVSVNHPPVVNAGEDANVHVTNVVTLDASGSYDQDAGDTLTYAWTQAGGETVTLSDASAEQPTFTVPEEATSLTFEVTVTDEDGASATDSVTYTVVTGQLVTFKTTLGDFVIELFDDQASETTTNFLWYVDSGFYDGTIFHRVIADFVVQGGGYLPDLSAQTPLTDPIANDFSSQRSNIRSTVAMAKSSGDPDSAKSQFFINLVDNSSNLDSQNEGFTVFGRVSQGMDVIDQMAAVTTESRTDSAGTTFDDVPVDDIEVTSAARQ